MKCWCTGCSLAFFPLFGSLKDVAICCSQCFSFEDPCACEWIPRNTTQLIERECETSRVKVKLQIWSNMCIQNMDLSHCHEMSHFSQSLTLFHLCLCENSVKSRSYRFVVLWRAALGLRRASHGFLRITGSMAPTRPFFGSKNTHTQFLRFYIILLVVWSCFITRKKTLMIHMRCTEFV